MSVSVGRLLDEIHARAWRFAVVARDPVSEPALESRWQSCLAGWPELARATVQALDALPVDLPWLDDTASVRESLAELAGGRGRAELEARVAPGIVPSRQLEAIGVRLGAIGDLMRGVPKAVSDADVTAALGVQSSILAAVHAVGVATLATFPRVGQVGRTRLLMRRLVTRTEPFALVPAARRSGRYEDVVAILPGEDSLDAAFAGWARVTVAVLASRHTVTGPALQTAATDVVVVLGAAGSVVQSALELGVVDPRTAMPAARALTAAQEAWRSPARWPTSIRLDGGTDPDHLAASRLVRQLITDTLREDGHWLSPRALQQRGDVPAALATVRRALHVAGQVALAHYEAVDGLVHGTGQLWVHGRAVARDGVLPAKGWVPLPRRDPLGEELREAAKGALTATVRGCAALDLTAAVPADGGAGGLVWERGRIVARPPDSPVYETVGTARSPWVREGLRPPVRLSEPPDAAPRP